VFVGASLFLGTTLTDQLLWATIIWSIVRALRTGRTRSWLLVGATAGIGLENKHTVAVLVLGVAVGVFACRPATMRSPGPWVAAAVALGLWTPNLWWDASHGWETLDMARTLANDQGGVVGSIKQLPVLLVLLPGPIILFLAVRGVRWAWRDSAGRTHSWIVVTAVAVVATFTLAGGKPYYPTPMLVPLFALGSVATELHRLGPTRRALVASAVVSSVLTLPYLPPSFASAVRFISREPMETYGWPALASQVAAVATTEPGAVAVYVSNYGEAGALATYGPSHGLTLPIVASQNAYRDWGPPAGTPADVIAVGEFDRSFLLRAWSQVDVIGTISWSRGLTNEETAEHATIFRCRGPNGTWAELWPRLGYLS
jgi:hypothetical protein